MTQPTAPAFILSADHHAYVGPTLRSLGNRIAFEERQGIREEAAGIADEHEAEGIADEIREIDLDA